jgi:erythronate-4-phosphate dehydrogenase
MKLVVDENIPCAAELLAPLGELLLLPGRAIDAEAVRDAQVLLVRSVTRVDAALVTGSALRFVGSATAGIDHVDTAELLKRGIAFASAPGSNADSVVDYVFSALAVAFPGHGELASRRVGIVGCGEVGARLLRRLRALGVDCVVCDPFRDDIPENGPLQRVLDCDVISIHVPLTFEGPHPTWHLLDAARLHALREDALLINTSRGPVVDNAALLESLAARPRMRAVLDVWEPEPEYDPRLLARCLVGTPHIAGYAADGKLRGMLQVHEALCAVMGVAGPPAYSLPLAGVLPDTLSSWQEAVLACYDLRADDARLRASLIADPAQRGRAFDRLRRDYPARREFSAWRLGDTPEPLRLDLLAAGFSP